MFRRKKIHTKATKEFKRLPDEVCRYEWLGLAKYDVVSVRTNGNFHLYAGIGVLEGVGERMCDHLHVSSRLAKLCGYRMIDEMIRDNGMEYLHLPEGVVCEYCLFHDRLNGEK